jgi:hypothetical protein
VTDLNYNWTELTRNTHQILGKQAGPYLDLLWRYHDDIQEGETTLLGWRRAPAAKGNHHAHEGGLVEHLLEMWSFWADIQDRAYSPSYVTPERIWKGILLHDVHKAHRTFKLLSTDPWEVDYAHDLTDQLLPETAKNLWLANQAGLRLDLEQTHALILAHGGYSELKPKQQSVLAKTLYLLDEFSGNVADRVRTKTVLELRKPTP